MNYWLLLSLVGLSACPSSPRDDDDSAGLDDDDSAVADDDDSTAADDDDSVSCSSAAPPYTIDVAGVSTASIEFVDLVCTPYGGDVWNITYRTSDNTWSLRLATGALVEGETTETDNSISLRKPAEQLEYTSARTGATVLVDVEAYGDSPCGSFTVDDLGDNSGGTVAMTAQPIPFRCP